MKNCAFLISYFILMLPNSLFGQSHLEVIDSLIFQARGNSKAIVLDNHQGDRHEYLFDNDGNLNSDIQIWLSDVWKNNMEKTLPNLIIDSLHFDLSTDFSYTYLLEKESNSYKPALIKIDTLTQESTEIIQNGDSTICFYISSPIQLKNTFVSKDNRYIYFQTEMGARKSGEKDILSWNIYYDKNKTFFIDPDFLFIYVLHYKNGVPIKLESCMRPRKSIVRTPDFIIKNYRKLRIEETTEIKYGENTGCLKNTMTSTKTMENFKKAHFLGY